MASALIDLAERCEKAAGPDREIDVLIEIECGLQGHKVRGLQAGSPLNTIAEIAKCGDGLFFKIPHYTASLDAAMTLVPEGHSWRCGFGVAGWAAVHQGQIPNYRSDPIAASAALALCAAALRARAQVPA